jgi:hypothetical protein
MYYLWKFTVVMQNVDGDRISVGMKWMAGPIEILGNPDFFICLMRIVDLTVCCMVKL